MKFRFLWVTDPWETLDHSRDTTIRLAQEALAQKLESFWCDVRSIRWEKGQALVDARRMESIRGARSASEISLGPVRAMSMLDFSSIQYRTDPPVDLAYAHPLQLLHLGARRAKTRSARPEIVNPAAALLLSSEKLEPGLLGTLLPPTVASSRWEPLVEFGRNEGKTVLKPLHLAQSRGVELIDWTAPGGEERARELIDAATDHFSRPVLLQRYLPAIAQGETRLWFLDGKLLACARKLPLQNDFRVNIDQGSRLAAHKLSASERKAAGMIGKHLRSLRVRMAAVDLIDGYATDFNLTSPGLITQMEEVLQKKLAPTIVRALSRRLR